MPSEQEYYRKMGLIEALLIENQGKVDQIQKEVAQIREMVSNVAILMATVTDARIRMCIQARDREGLSALLEKAGIDPVSRGKFISKMMSQIAQ